MDVSDTRERVLRVLAHGRSNTHHVCQQAGLDERAAERVLAELTADRLAVEVDRNLYEVTAAGRESLDRDYPAEAGFLEETELIHDAPAIKTLRLRGDRGLVEVQVDEASVPKLAATVARVLADTHGSASLSAVEGVDPASGTDTDA